MNEGRNKKKLLRLPSVSIYAIMGERSKQKSGIATGKTSEGREGEKKKGTAARPKTIASPIGEKKKKKGERGNGKYN